MHFALPRDQRLAESRSGFGALLPLGTLACDLPGGPRAVRYAVGALDQLSRRMRALATADSARRHHANLKRARWRRREPPPRALQLSFRKSRWPAWVRTDEHGEPISERGMLQLDHDARCGVPRLDSDAYRITVRDTYLLAALKPPADVDGRKLMALRHQRQLEPAERRPPRELEELELAELAHRTVEPVSVLRRCQPLIANGGSPANASRTPPGPARRCSSSASGSPPPSTRLRGE